MDSHLNSMLGSGFPPAQTGNEAVITPEVDALVDVIEGGGIMYYVMSGNGALPPFLTFEFHFTDIPVSIEAVTASIALTKLFNEDVEIRAAMIDHALSVGSAYSEVGTATFNTGNAA